jgi:signal transduction histidine kinase/ActR/RegA family two-component response regulator
MENSNKKALIQRKIDEVLARRSNDTTGEYSESLENLVEDLKIYQYELEFQKEELLRIQEELEISRNSFRDLFQNAPVGYVLLNNDFIIKECNQVFKKLFQLTNDCPPGTDFRRFIATPDQDRFYHFWITLLKDFGSHDLRVEMIAPGQTETLVIHLHGNTYGSSTDKQIRLSLTNITANEIQARKLAQSEARFNNLISRMNQAIVFGDVIYDAESNPCDLRIVGFNPAFERLTGITLHNMQEVKFLEAYSTLSDVWHEAFRKAVVCDEPVFVEGFVSFLNKFLSVVLYQNQPGQLAAVIDDITDKKEAEIKLRENALLLDLALTASLTVAWEMDLSTLTLRAQGREMLRSTFGLEATESVVLAFDEWSRLIYPDDMAIAINQLNSNVVYSEKLQVLRCRILNANGAIRWVELKGRVTKINSDGLPSVVSGIMNDVTDLVESQEIIEKQNAELILLNTQKDKLFSVIAHDLRSPFNTFLGFTELLAENVGSITLNELRSISESMHKSAVGLNNLLVNLLEWSRFQSGRLACQKEELVLLEIVNDSWKVLHHEAKAKKISLEVKISEGQKVEADQNMLMSVFRNLLSNAIKFSYEGSKVKVESKADGSRLNIVISDQGIGIPSDFIPVLFELSPKISRRGTNNEASTGLGLSIVKEFVNTMGGEISVESVPGKGSAFTIAMSCPFNDETGNDAETKMELIPASQLATIVLVEDDPVSATLFTIILNRAGYNVVHFGSSEAFLAYFSENYESVKLILLDVKLPDMDGIGLAREIRKTYGAEISIVAISAYYSSMQRQEALKAGCNDFLNKPVSREKLINTIIDYVQ